jgi:hypothetical protein
MSFPPRDPSPSMPHDPNESGPIPPILEPGPRPNPGETPIKSPVPDPNPTEMPDTPATPERRPFPDSV